MLPTYLLLGHSSEQAREREDLDWPPATVCGIGTAHGSSVCAEDVVLQGEMIDVPHQEPLQDDDQADLLPTPLL